MKRENISLKEVKLVGISARTNNLSEMNPQTAKIGLTMQRFFANETSSKINHKINPNRILAVYTDYESDFNGDYTYFIGQEVERFDEVESIDLESMVIPEQDYVKFTSGPAQMPALVIDMWKGIWSMNDLDLGGKRAYKADFEVYDERSNDLSNATVDVYIGKT
jgi:predicted transcriptional regulator YdeE